MRTAFVAISVRAYRIDHRYQAAVGAAEVVPVGVLRGLWVLNGKEAGAFTLAAPEALPGLLAAFEPGTELLDAVLMPLDAYVGRLVAHAGLDAWPVDPVNIDPRDIVLVTG